VSDESTQAALANTTPAASTNSDSGLVPGAVVADRWTIVGFLARGGMGEVYEAHDRLLDTPVALKTLRSGVAHERFLREVQLARKVTHPGVCRIHDAGRHGGLSFLTMELLAGEALSDRIKRGPIPIDEARPILADLAAALDGAHEAGVIHRDFKPHNVMLVRRGGATRAVITDFGIARAADDEGAAVLTGADEIIGTPAYMAPEQVTGKAISAATDVYSFGVVAYEMMTGTPPFTGRNAREVATARLTEKPRPPRELVTDLDPRWNDAILAALAIDPAARPQSAGAFLRLLDATSAPAPRGSRTRWIAPVILLAGVVAALVIWLSPSSRVEHSVAIDAATPDVLHSDAAKEHYMRGREHYDHGRFDAAITEFMQVDEDLRTPAMLYNMAQAYRMKGDAHQAVYFYRRFIDEAGEDYPPGMIERAKTQLDELAADAGVTP
jgi:eukaryotic-like serine/threonine-protein kinase